MKRSLPPICGDEGAGVLRDVEGVGPGAGFVEVVLVPGSDEARVEGLFPAAVVVLHPDEALDVAVFGVVDGVGAPEFLPVAGAVGEEFGVGGVAEAAGHDGDGVVVGVVLHGAVAGTVGAAEPGRCFRWRDSRGICSRPCRRGRSAWARVSRRRRRGAWLCRRAPSRGREDV